MAAGVSPADEISRLGHSPSERSTHEYCWWSGGMWRRHVQPQRSVRCLPGGGLQWVCDHDRGHHPVLRGVLKVPPLLIRTAISDSDLVPSRRAGTRCAETRSEFAASERRSRSEMRIREALFSR